MTDRARIKYILIAAIAISIAFPLLNAYYVMPMAEDALVKQTEGFATLLTRHFSEMIASEGGLLTDPDSVRAALSDISDLNVKKVKVFDEKGLITYSTDESEIGQLNEKPYFHDIVAKGRLHSIVVQKDALSMEGETMKLDIVETYVPLMRDGRFIGAFEIYYDATDAFVQSRAMVVRSTTLALFIMSVFLLITLTLVIMPVQGAPAYDENTSAPSRSPLRTLVYIALALFGGELAIMLILRSLPPMGELTRSVLDASILLLIASPLLYFFIFHPLIRSISIHRSMEKKLKGLVDDKDLLIKEVYHRVKNNLNVVQSLLSLQSTESESSEARSRLNESKDRIKAMSMIHERLYKSGDLRNVDAGEYISALTAGLFHNYIRPGHDVELVLDVKDTFIDIDKIIPMGLIINELVTNAMKYAFTPGSKGVLRVSLRRAANCFELRVADNGMGLPHDFNTASPKTLGMQLIKGLTEQIDGKLEIISSQGTEFIISFNCK